MTSFRHRIPVWAAWAAAALLGACTTVGPDHRPPAVNAGSGWTQPADTAAPALSRWWASFGDPELDRLVETALARNLELRQAEAAIRAARAGLARAEAAGEPVVVAGGSLQQRRVSRNSPEFNPQRSPDQTVPDAGFDASWEPDLFGQQRRLREAAAASLQAGEAERAGVRIAVAAEVARLYFGLRAAQAEWAAREATVDRLARSHALLRSRVAAGDLARSELDRSQARLDQAKSLLPAVEARRQASVLALAQLAGAPPEAEQALLAGTGTLPQPLAVPVGERADLLRRRPDVIAAERRLAAASAEIGAAEAERYPRLVLSASAGLRSLGLGDLIEAHGRRGAVGGLVSWRLFDGGRVDAEVRAAEARHDAAALAYERTLLAALNDAERALVQYEQSRRAAGAREAALASTRRSAVTARVRQRLGDASALETLDAERELGEQLAAQVQAQAAAVTDLVALYKALGGGWDVP